MKSFTTTLILLGLAWKSLAYNIDESCNCVRNPLILAVEEAIAVLGWGASVASACAVLDQLEDEEMQLICQNEKRSNLLEALFGDASGATYTKIGAALLPASKAPGTLSENPDGTITVVCGDAHLVKISTGVYRDKERGYAYVRIDPAPGPEQTPCDVLQALTYPLVGQASQYVVMLCGNTPGAGINQRPTFGELNKGNIVGKDVDFLNGALSSVFTHELIHVGGITQFPRELGPNQLEVYNYNGCIGLENTDYKFSNCDSMAITARVLYMNNYYVVDGVFRVLPRTSRPPPAAVNPQTPLETPS